VGDGRVYEHVNGRDVAVRVSGISLTETRMWEHIVERGVVPGSNGEF